MIQYSYRTITKLPINTPERMVEHFKEELSLTHSEDMKIVLNKLIDKWSGWHGYIFRSLCLDEKLFRVNIVNYQELFKKVILINIKPVKKYRIFKK